MMSVEGEQLAVDRPLEAWDVELSRSISAYGEKYQASNSREWSLPGHGERGEGCGVRRSFSCLDDGYAFVSPSSCMKRDCPDCYPKWASLLGRRVAWRLWSVARLLVRERKLPYWRVVHTVVSIPDVGQSLRRAKARVLRVVKQHGVNGGVAVLHGTRAVSGHYVADGYLHYHVFGVALGDIVPGGQPKDGDLVFKVIRDAVHQDFNGFRSQHELARAVSYALSHASIVVSDEDADGTRHGRHAVTWFGVASYNQVSVVKLKALHPEGHEAVFGSRGVRCPKCHGFNTIQTGEFSPDGSLDPGFALKHYQRTNPSFGQWRVERGGDV